MSCLVLAFGLMIILVLNARASPLDGITCEEALTQLITCNPYFLGFGPSPSPICCKGVQNVSQQANSTTIRRSCVNVSKLLQKRFKLYPKD